MLTQTHSVDEEEPMVKKPPKFPKDKGNKEEEHAVKRPGDKDPEDLDNNKEQEEPVFKKGIYKCKKISYVAKFDTHYLKKMLKSS